MIPTIREQSSAHKIIECEYFDSIIFEQRIGTVHQPFDTLTSIHVNAVMVDYVLHHADVFSHSTLANGES